LQLMGHGSRPEVVMFDVTGGITEVF
jgi:hypothetical protein